MVACNKNMKEKKEIKEEDKTHEKKESKSVEKKEVKKRRMTSDGSMNC